MTEEEKKLDIEKREQAQNEAYLDEINNNHSLDRLLKGAEDYRKGIRREVWPTGFATFDKALDGGFYGSQLICIGAISSLGKTSFILQIATQIADEKKDVLIFSLEMSRDELNAKTVSRFSHELDYYYELHNDSPKKNNERTRFTTNEVLKGDVEDNVASYDAFIGAVEKARKIADHVFIHVGNNDVSVDTIKDTVARHIKATGRRPVVVLDYLQILTPTEDAVKRHYDTRRSTDADITNLKVLARENDIPVIVISAFNRASYTDPVSMSSFRESSGIEYSADILLGLQYEGMEYKTTDNFKKRESDAEHFARVQELFELNQKIAAAGDSVPLELKILKNRNGSRATIGLDFTPKYNFFEEKKTDEKAQTTTAPGLAKSNTTKKRKL